MNLEAIQRDFRLSQLIKAGVVKVRESLEHDPKTGKEVAVRTLHFPVGLHTVED